MIIPKRGAYYVTICVGAITGVFGIMITIKSRSRIMRMGGRWTERVSV